MEMISYILLMCLLFSGLVHVWPFQICSRSFSGNYTVACYVCSDCSSQDDCMAADCMSQQCADFVRLGGCCDTCPNGPNCWVESSIVSFGRVVSFDNGTKCSCVEGEAHSVKTQCRAADGTLYFHGPTFVVWM